MKPKTKLIFDAVLAIIFIALAIVNFSIDVPIAGGFFAVAGVLYTILVVIALKGK